MNYVIKTGEYYLYLSLPDCVWFKSQKRASYFPSIESAKRIAGLLRLTQRTRVVRIVPRNGKAGV